MLKLEDIFTAYFSARKNKRKSPDQVEFELHWERNCVSLYNDICDLCVKPTAYTFVTDYPKPREVFASDMATRILHHYLDIRLRPLLEARMSNHTFNNRIGMGQNACQNAVISDIYEVSQGFTRDAWIVKLDMKGCFPNINQDIAYRQLLDVIENDYDGEDKDELKYILSVCIYSYPTHHCYRKSSLAKWVNIPKEKSLFHKPDGIGAAIGHLIWQNAVNYYFHEIDEWLLSLGLHYERYVDDLYFVVDNKEAFLLLIPEIRRRLAEIGARLNDSKFYCQHYTKGVECLGTHIKMDRIYPNNRVVRRGIQRAREFNRCIRENKVQTVLSTLNSYLGICKNLNGYGQAWRIVSNLSPKWNKYLEFDKRRVCIVAKNGYKINQQIIKKYKLCRSKKKRWSCICSVREKSSCLR